MLKRLLFFLILCCLSLICSQNTFAAQDPLSVPNNKIGIHILFPDELPQAASLVNSSGGDWGYVTIPLQIGDHNLTKWQGFMDDCRKYHIIPIIRLATEGYYFNTNIWRKPTIYDVIDSANFLNSLDWPTKNKYVVIFNEPNRADEWGGDVNPSEYADLLSTSVNIFKARNPDFFVIMAGMDNASVTISNLSMDEFEYYRGMNAKVPGIFNQIDGFASHSYPNPAFSAPPTKQDGESINSFAYEKQIITSLGGRDLPVFITETGWSKATLSLDTIATYYEQALSGVWSNPKIVAVTPFLLRAVGTYSEFSLIDNNQPNAIYNAWQTISKIKGQPALVVKQVLGIQTTNLKDLPTKDFSNKFSDSKSKEVGKKIEHMLELFFQ